MSLVSATEEDDVLYYTYDRVQLNQLRTEAPWKNDAKYFNRVVVSLSALMKMVIIHSYNIIFPFINVHLKRIISFLF